MSSTTESPTTAVQKKITVFTPTDIKKIGLDKLIKVQAQQKSPPQPSPAKSPVKNVEDVPQIQQKKETETAESFSLNLQRNFQKVLGPKKISNKVGITTVQDVLVTSPKKNNAQEGKFKIVQNEVIVVKQNNLNKIVQGQSATLNAHNSAKIINVDNKTAKNVEIKRLPSIIKKCVVVKPATGLLQVVKRDWSSLKVYKGKRPDITSNPINVEDDKVKNASPGVIELDEEPPVLSPVAMDHSYDEKVESRTDSDQPLQEPPPKKKRGRKSKAELARLALLNEGKDEEPPELSVSTSQRGRIRKPKVFENYAVPKRKVKDKYKEEDTSEDSDWEEVVTPKKRGRKPQEIKNSEEDQSLIEGDNKETMAQNEEEEEQPNEPEPTEVRVYKKRGRKPKVVKPEVAEDDDKEEETSEVKEAQQADDQETLQTEEKLEEETTTTTQDKTEEEEEDQEPETPILKKRGRPPKKRKSKMTPVPKQSAPDKPVGSGDAKVETKGSTTTPKVKRGHKRKWIVVQESPSTSSNAVAVGVDEPSKKPKLNESNSIEHDNVLDRKEDDAVAKEDGGGAMGERDEKKEEEGVADEEENAYAKQNRILYENLIKDIKEKMSRAEHVNIEAKPKMHICAVCRQQMEHSKWSQHKLRYHCNLTWHTKEKPLDLDNQGLVFGILNAMYPKKTFYCDQCSDSKRSVIGYLMHKFLCNRTEEELETYKEPCSLCSAMVFPYQLVEHDKKHRTALKVKKEFAILDTSLRDSGKRAAATKANELIQKVNEWNSTGDEGKGKMASIKNTKLLTVKSSGKLQDVLRRAFLEEKFSKCFFPSCDFSASEVEVETMLDHIRDCSFRPEEFYICKICIKLYENFVDIREHLCAAHDEWGENDKHADIEYETESDEETKEIRGTPRRKAKYVTSESSTHSNAFWKMFKFTNLGRPMSRTEIPPKGICQEEYARMLDFCKENYCAELYKSYPFKKANWFPLNNNYIHEYLPLYKKSMEVGEEMCINIRSYGNPDNENTRATFSRYPLFKTSWQNDIATIYCGGSISALAWAPTPYDKKLAVQILAVSIRPDPDLRENATKTHTYKSIIQLWNFGVLCNNKPLSIPTLELCIAHNYGGIFSMEWCPSGCYEVDGTRLGLLAITSTDSNVYVYSIGHSTLLTEKVFKPKPIFKLVLSRQFDMNFADVEYYPTALSWSKARGHKYIAVGYTNGCVGLFNLQASHETLKGFDDDEKIGVFYPYKVFKAHNLNITALSLHHLDGGNRWLTTSSADRFFKLWDLHLSTLKALISNKRATANHIRWPVNAITTLNANDDSSSNLYLSTITTNLVNFEYVHNTTIMHSNAAVRAMSGHDWGSTIYQGNDIGEVVGAQLSNLYPFVIEPNLRRFICSNSSLLPLNSSNDTEKSSEYEFFYAGARKNYKLLFHDYKLCSPKEVIPLDRSKRNVCETVPSQFSLQAVTAMSTNNNKNSFLFNAVGYNVGFVRVFHSNFQNRE